MNPPVIFGSASILFSKVLMPNISSQRAQRLIRHRLNQILFMRQVHFCVLNILQQMAPLTKVKNVYVISKYKYNDKEIIACYTLKKKKNFVKLMRCILQHHILSSSLSQ